MIVEVTGEFEVRRLERRVWTFVNGSGFIF
jgi:hypothetical protein